MTEFKNISSLDSEIFKKLRILASLRIVVLKMALGIEYLPDRYRGVDKRVLDFIIGLDIISDSLVLGINNGHFIQNLDIENPIKTIKEQYCKYNYPHEAVVQKFGLEYSFVYLIVEITNLIFLLSSINYILKPTDRILDKKLANDFIKELSIFLISQKNAIEEFFGKKIRKKYSKLISLITDDNFDELQWQISSQAGTIAGKLFPEFRIINERLKRLNPLFNKLDSCEAGKNGWKNYEEICLEIVEYLFVPEFKGVIPQSSVSSGTQRRDALLYNDKKTGFWGAMKTDYECKHVLFEFKNVESLNKKDILQISNYLSKPGIGRFGIIFTRKDPSKAVFKHLEETFIFDKKIILTIDDSSLKKLMYEKAYYGTCNDFLNYLKGSFERKI